MNAVRGADARFRCANCRKTLGHCPEHGVIETRLPARGGFKGPGLPELLFVFAAVAGTVAVVCWGCGALNELVLAPEPVPGSAALAWTA